MKYVKSTIKAPEQRDLYCSDVIIFDFRDIFTTQLKIYIVNSQKLKCLIKF